MTGIAFIGGGNMASSIIGGLIEQGERSAKLIEVAEPNPAQRDLLEKQFQVNTHTEGLQAIARADVVILAVKPQVAKDVLMPLQATLQKNQPLLISIAAGIDIASLSQWSGCRAIVRAMPNTPALLREGATGLYANKQVSQEQRDLADSLLRAVGLTVWVGSEDKINAVTALSGSGPAYFFLLMEAMIDAAVNLGLTRQAATDLCLQTAQGAGKMARQSDVEVAELRRRVTSPGGTTEQAITSFEQANLRGIVSQALQAAHQRAIELSQSKD
ncbi:MAG: pyrroline-5-carboxylate reductase [Venatoribacter sp.]